MRKILLWVLFFLIPFLYSIYVCAQPKKDERDCSSTCFSSSAVSVEKISGTCTSYELKVTYSGDCAHALSHYTVAVPCGTITDVWNSQGWAQEIGTDPTTGLTGLKIDNTANFGEGTLQHFTVKFTVCSTGDDCAGLLNCWQPQVAYKASTCVNYETVAVGCTSLKASLEKSDASCFGTADGSLSVVIDEGQEPYSFLWSNAATDQSISGLAAGVYQVVLKDASGAELILTDTISESQAIIIAGSSAPSSCNGVANGSVDISVSGGEGPYSFLWTNGSQTEDVDSLAAGKYTVTVTDQNQCVATASFTVGNSSKINITGSHVKPDCNDSNGSINITASGGTSPYTFSWSNGAATEDLQNIVAGLYTVTVTDAAGCSEKASYFIRENNTLALAGVTTPTSCTGDASGSIDLSVSGGTAPYSFSWSSGQTSEDLSTLANGYYTVTVTDAKGCMATAGFVISKTTFQVPSTVVQPSCSGESNGSITLQQPVGGTAPYTYQWSSGSTATSLTDLAPGTYSVTVTDATGCSRTLTFTIKDPQEIMVSAAVSSSQCNADGSFSIDLTVSGGVAPYAFEWSNGSNAEDPDSLTTGAYTVVVTDKNGCTVSKDITVEGQPPAWSCLIDELASMPLCGSVNNVLSTSIEGADSYAWTVSSTDGSWSLSATDAQSVFFTTGGANTSATFTLIIVKDGCTQMCTYTITACASQDGGGSDPDGQDPGSEPGDGDGGDQSCEECFETTATLLQSSGSCRTYEMLISTNGLCRHELSHWTLAIPCGTLSAYWNSEGWKMEYGKDPTTGLYGLKVDDINSFGKDVDSFTVRFTVCESNGCALASWEPSVAYKAGLCVGLDTIEVSQTASRMTSVSVYPNPFNDVIRFEWNSSGTDVSLQIIDQYGNTLSALTPPEGASYIALESSAWPTGMYYYKLTVEGQTYSGKISRH